ncbi:MAG: YybH family protein [Bacillota bacterium]
MFATSPQEALKMYEEATNTHEFENVRRLLREDAIYYFSDETVQGHKHLKEFFEKTWDYIHDEVYKIYDVQWITIGETNAACIYKFQWSGLIGGVLKEGKGRGTNVFEKDDEGWKVVHEHLSS